MQNLNSGQKQWMKKSELQYKSNMGFDRVAKRQNCNRIKEGVQIKTNSNGERGKYKAHLVAHRY